MTFYRLRALFRRARMERDLRDEMAFHATTSGRSVELEATAEACRDARGVSPLENTLRDLRYAARGLWHTPGFTVPALLTLALGLGAAIAIFSVANAVLLQPLAYPGANRLVELRERIALVSQTPVAFSAPDIAQVRSAGSAFATLASFEESQRDLTVAGEPAARVRTARVSANLFPMLGARPLLGHNFTPAQDAHGDRIAILSHALWQSRFGANPRIVGQRVQLDGALYTIAGVMPPDFAFPPRGLPGNRPAGVFVPMSFTPAELSDFADNFDVGVLAQLRPGATLAAARAQMAVASHRILETWAQKLGTVPGLTLQVTVDSLRSLVIGPARVLMDLLLGAAVLLLLLSCANVANLFLVRATARCREFSLRAALGASGGRLIRQALTESTLLSLAACGAGLLLAWGALAVLTAAAPATLPQVQAIRLDGRAVLIAIAVALLVGPLCGLLPALAAARRDHLERSLREDAPSLAGARGGARTRQILVIAQVAIAFVLVCSAGLLVRSFLRAEQGSSGVQPHGVATAVLLLPSDFNAKPGRSTAFLRRLMQTAASQPGVIAASVSTGLPTAVDWERIFSIEGQPAPAGTPLPLAVHTLVQGSYFRTLGIPVLQGRTFDAQEAQGGANVAIVNAALARHYWPHGSAVGHRLSPGTGGAHAQWLTIVGVVGDVKASGLDQPSGYQTYEPYAQACKGGQNATCRNLYLAVRTRGGAQPPLRRMVAAVEPGVPVTRMRSLQAVLDASITPRRFNTLLLATFGIAALLLAAIGLYGVLAFSVAGRKRELAVRMALGAAPGAVARLVVSIGGRLALVGLAGGALAAWLLAALLRVRVGDLLYRTATFDPLTWIAAAALLLGVAFAAAYFPARRASRIPPLEALRED